MKKPIIFKGEKIDLIYDYSKITVLQAESAIEILKFKNDQDFGKPESFKQVQRSGGHAWRSMILAFLLCEYKEGKTVKYQEGDEERNRKIIQELTGDDTFKKMEDCINDFFTKRKMLPSLLAAKQSVVEQNMKTQFLQLLTNNMITMSRSSSLPSKTEEETPPTMKTS